MNDIEFIYFEKARRGGGRHTDQNSIRVQYSKAGTKSVSYRIDLNQKITGYIQEAGVEFACIALNKLTGQTYLVFDNNSDQGYPISMPTEKNPRAVIYSKKMAEFIRTRLGLK